MMTRSSDRTTPIPDGAQQTFDEGTRKYVAGENDDAVTLLEKAIAAYAEFGDAYYMLGLAKLRIGDRDGGLAALRTVSEVSENHTLQEYAAAKIDSVEGDLPAEGDELAEGDG